MMYGIGIRYRTSLIKRRGGGGVYLKLDFVDAAFVRGSAFIKWVFFIIFITLIFGLESFRFTKITAK